MPVSSRAQGFCTTGQTVAYLSVGAVYDRAVFAIEWDKRAVIDRTYRRKWPPKSFVVQARAQVDDGYFVMSHFSSS